MRMMTNIHEEPITKIEDHVQDPMDDTSTLSKMTKKNKVNKYGYCLSSATMHLRYAKVIEW